MQLSFQSIFFAVGAQSVLGARFVCGVPSQCSLILYLVKDFLSFGTVTVVFCKGRVACQLTQIFGGFLPMCQILFFQFFYYLVLPDVVVVVCWTESQNKLAVGTLFWM